MNEKLSPIEILNHLDSFYNNAWNKLILFTTILLAIVGIIVPLIITWFQNRNLKLKEQNLRNEIELDYKKKLQIIKQDLLKQTLKEIDEKIEKFDERQDKLRAELKGLHFHLQANATQDDTKGKLTDFIIASEFYIKGEDYLNLRTTVDCICDEIENSSKEELKEIKEDAADIANLIELLGEIDEKGSFTSQIRDLKKKIKKLPEKRTSEESKK